jgi:predicted enzyme related to lactoylglutathione lyase
MSNPMQTHGAPSWLELHTDDVEQAKKFYTEVLGWGIRGMEMSDGNTYNALVLGDGTIGGIVPVQGGPTRWLTYVTVDDVEKRTKRAQQSGAKVLSPPAAVPGVGTMSTIEDPTGAAICFITYAQG